MDLSQFLVWLATGGSLIAASWVLGQFSWYTKLVEKTRQWVFFSLAVVFASGAFAINTYVSAEILAKIAPWFLIVAFVFSAIFLNKAYTLVKAFGRNLEALDNKLSNFLLENKAKVKK